jgi:hypothetical protein
MAPRVPPGSLPSSCSRSSRRCASAGRSSVSQNSQNHGCDHNTIAIAGPGCSVPRRAAQPGVPRGVVSKTVSGEIPPGRVRIPPPPLEAPYWARCRRSCVPHGARRRGAMNRAGMGVNRPFPRGTTFQRLPPGSPTSPTPQAPRPATSPTPPDPRLSEPSPTHGRHPRGRSCRSLRGRRCPIEDQAVRHSSCLDLLCERLTFRPAARRRRDRPGPARGPALQRRRTKASS